MLTARALRAAGVDLDRPVRLHERATDVLIVLGIWRNPLGAEAGDDDDDEHDAAEHGQAVLEEAAAEELPLRTRNRFEQAPELATDLVGRHGGARRLTAEGAGATAFTEAVEVVFGS